MDPKATESKYKKRDDASARLGEKLLQGWTMLATNCPSEDCFTPLVRSKQGRMFCVNCDQFVVTEEEARQRAMQAEPTAKQQQEEAERAQLIAARAAQEQVAREQREREEMTQLQQQRQQQQQQQNQHLQLQQQQQQQPPTAAVSGSGTGKRKSEAVPLSTSADDDTLADCRRRTLAALYQKLEELTESISTSDHLERMLTTTKAIRELSTAIQALAQTSL